MHYSAMKFAKIFFDTYVSRGLKVVEIGSQDVNGSLKDAIPPGTSYIGVDFVEGRNVDIVLEDPYTYPFEDNSIDVVVCSSCLEHSEFFWLSFNEMLRILKPSGLLYLNVPSNGVVHRYPLDCWRFYPDAGRALESWGRREHTDLKLLESFVGSQLQPFREPEEITAPSRWNDFIAVFLKDAKHCEIPTKRMLDTCNHIASNPIINGKVLFETLTPLPQDLQIIESLKHSSSVLNTKGTDITMNSLVDLAPLSKLNHLDFDSLAWVGHIPFAYHLVSWLKPNRIVELGTFKGNSLNAFCQSVRDNALDCKVYGVDAWEGDLHMGTFSKQVFESVSNAVNSHYSDFIKLKKGYFSDMVHDFEDNSIDLLHIDGLHTYEAVKEDFETWLPKLSPKAVVLFHDTTVEDTNFGVNRFWGEVSKLYPSFNFNFSHGLGVLAVGTNVPSLVIDFIHLANRKPYIVNEVFFDLSRASLPPKAFEYVKRLKEAEGFGFKFLPETVNTLRDAAVSLEEKNLEQSLCLMSLAHYLRPHGPFIKEKYLEYRNIVENKRWRKK